MHTIKDFAALFNCHTNTIHNYLKEIKPLLNGFDAKKRKRQYTDTEAREVIALITTKLPKKDRHKFENLSTK